MPTKHLQKKVGQLKWSTQSQDNQMLAKSDIEDKIVTLYIPIIFQIWDKEDNKRGGKEGEPSAQLFSSP